MKRSKGAPASLFESKAKDPRTFQRFGVEDLTWMEQRVLDYVAKWPGIMASEISTAWGLTTPAVGPSIRRLVQKTRIERRKVRVVDDAGSHHSAWALYVKKK